MTETAPPRRGRLTTDERAAVIAGVLTMGADAPAVLARVSAACRDAAVELLAQQRDARAAHIASEVAALWSPVPRALTLVHRDWIEAQLVGESNAVRDAVAGGGEVRDWARRWLQQRAFAGLVGMPGSDVTEPFARLALAPVPALRRGLAAFGRGAFAAALADAARGEIAAVAARLGEPHGSLLVGEIAAIVNRGDAAEPHTRALATLVHGLARGASEQALVDAGLKRLARIAAVAPGDGARQLAQRLPLALGHALLAEVAAARDGGGAPAQMDGAELAAFAALI